MPESNPQPPQAPTPWDSGWNPDSSRAPGTRRLWLAGALALATVVACVTAIAVTSNEPEKASPAGQTPSALANGPGLLSFASPSPSRTAPKEPKADLLSPSPTDTATATASATPHKDAPASGAPSAPAKSSAAHGGSSGSEPSADWTSLRSVNYPDRYWHVSGDYVKLDPVYSASDRQDATFRQVSGLADSSCYSFATADGTYLRHRDFLLRAERNDGSDLFRQDATFCPRASAYSSAVMLESVNYPGRFLRHKNFQLRLDPYQYSSLYMADSAFQLVGGLA
jgi:hypothetical protein